MSIKLEGDVKVLQKRMAALEERIAKLESAEPMPKSPAEFKPAKAVRLT